MRITILAFLILSAVTAGALAADPPVRVSLTLLPASNLPGLPVGFLLTIANPSPKPATIMDYASLKVTTAAETFDAVDVARSKSINLPPTQMETCYSAHCLTVPANGQRQLYLGFGPLLIENYFFADRRLSFPGRYDLQVTLLVLNLAGSEMTEIHTDTQTLIIQQPTGSDLAVWNFLQQTSGGKGWSQENWIYSGEGVAKHIRTIYPSSNYVPWVGAIGPASPLANELAELDGALAANPPAALRDELLLAKGGVLQGWSDHVVFNERDADKAANLADQARTVFSQLLADVLTDYTRSLATKAVSHLLTRAGALDDVRMFAANDPPAPAFVVPRVECVTKGPGQSFTASFGYSNPNRVVKVLQIGPDNQVTPAPREQGQPRVFKPGDHANVFVAASPGGNLKWHLDGSTATANADFPTTCSQ